jgi:hypothetical protein
MAARLFKGDAESANASGPELSSGAAFTVLAR